MKIWKQEEWAEKLPEAEPAGINPAEAAEERKQAREKAVYYLQFSGKTESELRKKLAEQAFSPASVDSAIQFVKERRYLDDEDYARRYIERYRMKKSRKQMLFELAGKGIRQEILEVVFEDAEIDEEAQILAVLEKKNYAGADASREESMKITAYLTRKGFSYEAVRSVLIQFARKN